MESEKLKIYQNRLLVSDLIIDVLTDKKTVQQAISLFPKEKNDINLKCAFDALMYREADEDIRSKYKDYASLQDDYLELIARTLKDNEQLPKNVILRYLKYNSENLLPDEDKTLKQKLKKLKRMINF